MDDFSVELKNWFLKNLANAVTILGFLDVIWLLVMAVIDPEKLWLITILALFAGLSDFFDGIIARKLKAESEFGSVIDRLRDKILVVPILIIFIFCRGWGLTNLPSAIVSLTIALVISLITIEIFLFIAWWIGLFKKVTTKANKWGKRKMFCEIVVIMLWLIVLNIEKYLLHVSTMSLSIYFIFIDLILIVTVFLAVKSLEGYWQSYQSYQS